MDEKNYVRFKFHYTLSRKIPFTELLDNIPNVQLISEDNSLIGFNITLHKTIGLDEAQSQSEEYAYLLSHLISIISHEYTIPNLGDYEAFDAAGNKHIGSNLILMFSVEGAPAKLDMTNQVTSILESDEPQIRTHLGYLAKAVVLEYEHFS